MSKNTSIEDIKFEIEDAKERLNEPLTLMGFLSDELDDLYTGLCKVNDAKTPEDKLKQQQFVTSYLSSRIDKIIRLNGIASDLITQRQDQLNELDK